MKKLFMFIMLTMQLFISANANDSYKAFECHGEDDNNVALAYEVYLSSYIDDYVKVVRTEGRDLEEIKSARITIPGDNFTIEFVEGNEKKRLTYRINTGIGSTIVTIDKNGRAIKDSSVNVFCD